MKVHFVCTGNKFRSRLAEAYLNSKTIDGVEVSSSGIEAIKDLNGPITWYAQRIIQKNRLVPFESMSWTQTTKEILEKKDWVIFVQQSHYDQCVQRFEFGGKNFEIWDIEDLNGLKGEAESRKISRSGEIYQKITQKVDDFISRRLT
jgi:protein-tyrosine-phosphatase